MAKKSLLDTVMERRQEEQMQDERIVRKRIPCAGCGAPVCSWRKDRLCDACRKKRDAETSETKSS